jgi:hypothetical protein
VDAGQALAAAHEVEQRLAARGGGRGVLGIVEELAGGAGQEERVVLREVLLVDVGRVVGDGGGPGARLLAHLLDGRARRAGSTSARSRRPAEHEHAAGASGLAGALSGSAATMACTSSGFGVWFWGSRGSASSSAAGSPSGVTADQPSNVASISARVRTPS